MPASTVKIPSSSGGAFDCYLALPASPGPTPAIVLANAIVGVDEDLRGIADEFAAAGYIAAAPDLFWRSVPGPLPHEDPRTRPRGQPRLEKIRTGEADMADTLAYVRTLPQHNGRAAAMGFCYGGPYAILGPKRLGYDAGVSCHGTQLLDFIQEIEDLPRPSAFCGAISTLPHHPMCETPIARRRRGRRTLTCMSFPASTTATCCRTAGMLSTPASGNSRWRERSRSSAACAG